MSEGKIWQKRAQCDLIAGHKTMLASHPGPVDPLNPGFMKTANAALQNALSLAQNIKTPAGYQSVMDAYTAAFKDGHFQLITTKKLWDLPTGTGGFKWAGILIGWRADTFTAVYTHETSGVKQGDELVSCDGIKAADMMHENVFPYSHYSDNNPNSWAMLSRHLLADNGNPLIKTPQNCLFSGAKGEYKVVLNWQARPKNYWDIAPKALFGATPKTGMKEIKPGIWWVNAANFSPQNDAQLKANKDMIADIKAKQ
ncbi:MAG TPA: hypothetical protein ENJ46_04355, partial [Hellea balneolensis]|nr:hypothetical protein [Hellea balneolensis]